MASMEPLVAKRNLTVDFAPEFVKMAIRPDRPRAGHNATLVCETVRYSFFSLLILLFFSNFIFYVK